LRRVGGGERFTLTNPGEQRLDAWMADHCRVAWREVADPWRLEREILASGQPLPLNIRDNPSLAHTAVVQAALRRSNALGRSLTGRCRQRRT
jgi:hypothetical protein